jgi:hypothetical protein
VKFFSSIELIGLLAESQWLDDATKTIGLYWKRKNARLNLTFAGAVGRCGHSQADWLCGT